MDVGDILMVKTGAKVPVDGTVISGEGYQRGKYHRRIGPGK